MLGFYEGFPANVHKTAVFTTLTSSKRLQEQIIRLFHELNANAFNLEDVAAPSIPQCTVIFEFGIAETNSFNYLDNEEVAKVLETIHKKPLQIMDFFCVIRYYKETAEEKKKPLKFDYYILRFLFNKNTVEILIFHEKGPRYVSPEEIIAFLTNKINEASSKKVLRVLESS
ncbi:MAG: hypothetical protein ACPLZC_06035 [Candidatus Bathyarchaeales archaeon]